MSSRLRIWKIDVEEAHDFWRDAENLEPDQLGKRDVRQTGRDDRFYEIGRNIEHARLNVLVEGEERYTALDESVRVSWIRPKPKRAIASPAFGGTLAY